MQTREAQAFRPRTARLGLAALALFVAGTQSGCTRQFFREWANQDATEVIFEKSRDPRWRLDIFSWEPPVLSRFADPYNRDFPPAPPDDYPSEALSPVPQWPDNRLLVPGEGTGYLDLMESWRPKPPDRLPIPRSAVGPPTPVNMPPRVGNPPRTAAPPPPPTTTTPFGITPAGDGETNPGAPPASNPGGTPGTPTPGAPGTQPPGTLGARSATVPGAQTAPRVGSTLTNRGTNAVAASPIPLRASQPAAKPAAPVTGRTVAQAGTRDPGVRRTALQQPPSNQPVPPSAAPPTQPQEPVAPGTEPPGGPAPNTDRQLDPILREFQQRENVRPDLTDDQYEASEAKMAELAGILVVADTKFNINEESGLRHDDTPYVLTVDQAFRLALINSRFYQFQIENVYLSALAVTLQRFAFQPQFYAGMSPVTAPLNSGFPGLSPPNRFSYATRATGVPASGLTLGTVAGVGKAFSAGGKLLMGYANEVVFNFFGKNSAQPGVQSFLPLSFTQPFLSGGGRAVTLEALTQAERNLLYQIRLFALSRQQFTVFILIGGSIQNFGSVVASLGVTTGGNSDPNTGYINVLEDLQILENQRRNVITFANYYKIFQELKEGEASGLTQLQVDQLRQNFQTARLSYLTQRVTYRNDLDAFKQQLGMPPDTVLVPDRSLTQPFKDTFDGLDRWGVDRARKLSDLPNFLDALPKLQDVILDGRSVLALAKNELLSTDGSDFYEENLEDVLRTAGRIGLEHRLDLMNTRAQLYDAWRQVRVSANALKGVFNVSITNQFVTPPTTTNPFGFLDQAKEFSLVLNAELPLIRMSQRNNYATQLINYQRARRTLQNSEDAIKQLVRADIRAVILNYLQYEIQKLNFILFARVKDQAFEQIVAPPAAGAAGNTANAAVQTQNLIGAQSGLIGAENNLVTEWYQYQGSRLALYRDLGILPYDEWEAYRELFPAETTGGGTGYVSREPEPARTPEAVPARLVGGR
jgi:hypothetical protein